LGEFPAYNGIDIPQFRFPAYVAWEKVIKGNHIGSDAVDVLGLIGKLIVPLVEEASLAGIGLLDEGLPKCRDVLCRPNTVLRP